MNDDVRGRANDFTGFASRLGGTPVLEPREVEHPAFPEAVVRTPGIILLESDQRDAYSQECFGPVVFVIKTDSTEQSLQIATDTIQEHGAMTMAVYSTDEEVLADAREAAADAGVALSENLQGQVFVNQTAAFSDFHGTGANPAAKLATLVGGMAAGADSIDDMNILRHGGNATDAAIAMELGCDGVLMNTAIAEARRSSSSSNSSPRQSSRGFPVAAR